MTQAVTFLLPAMDMASPTIIAIDVEVSHSKPEGLLCLFLTLLVLLCSLWQCGRTHSAAVARAADPTHPAAVARAADPIPATARSVGPTASAARAADPIPATGGSVGPTASVARAADLAVSAARAADLTSSVAGVVDGLVAGPMPAAAPASRPMSVARAVDNDQANSSSRDGNLVMPRFPDSLPYLRTKKIQDVRGRSVRILQAPSHACEHAEMFNSAYNQWGWNVRCPSCPLMAHIRWASEAEAKSARKEEMCDVAKRLFQL